MNKNNQKLVKTVKETLFPSHIIGLDMLEKLSNQVLKKNEDGSISGLRYVVSAEPSTLRPVKSWIINIEQWHCDEQANIVANDILFIRILNSAKFDAICYDDCIRDVHVHNQKLDVENTYGFNALMASVLFISKIDAGRVPDIQKTLSTYNLIG